MRQIATMTSKGQITVPRAFRERLKVAAGDRIAFEEKDGKVVVSAMRDEDPFEEFRGIGTPGIGKGKKAVLRWIREVRGEL
jgi:AbrB family looped-hinge helix DNA binding protein